MHGNYDVEFQLLMRKVEVYGNLRTKGLVFEFILNVAFCIYRLQIEKEVLFCS